MSASWRSLRAKKEFGSLSSLDQMVGGLIIFFFRRKSLSNSLDLALFKDPVYVNIAFGLSLSITSDLAFLSIFPLLLELGGFTKSELTLLLTIYFTSDLICRILLSIATVFVNVRNRYLFLFGAFFSAVFRTGNFLDKSSSLRYIDVFL